MNVTERLLGTYANARGQIEGQIQVIEARATELERRAKESLDAVPVQLRGAWLVVLEKVRGALDFATRDELLQLSERVEELSQKIDKLVRGEKIRDAVIAKSEAASEKVIQRADKEEVKPKTESAKRAPRPRKR